MVGISVILGVFATSSAALSIARVSKRGGSLLISLSLAHIAPYLSTSASANTYTAISATQYQTLSLYEQYAAASYCPGNDGGALGTPITCSTGVCNLVQSANATVLLGISTSTKTDTASFVSIDNVNRIIAVSFRGTESIRQYVVDLDMTLASIPTCNGCDGFQGIYNAWAEVRDEITAAVSSAVQQNPGYTVLATGHSLGAGIATFAAAELRQKGFVVDMVGFVQALYFTRTNMYRLHSQVHVLAIWLLSSMSWLSHLL
jgi:Lipase (class 3)/Lipase 3 N-terminal region